MNDSGLPATRGQRESGARSPAPALTKVTTLADRVRTERQRSFVGRTTEITLFARLLSDATRSLLFVSGPVGVGKSALLSELKRLAVASGHPALSLDVALLAEQPRRALPTLRARLTSFCEATGASRAVLFVDGFERLSNGGEALLAEVEGLTADILVVIASRRELPATLALDAAWSRLLQQRDLSPFSSEEADEFLEHRGVAAEARRSIQELAQGSALGLAVAAELVTRHGEERLTLARAQEVQRTLARLLCPTSLSHDQQLALDVCSAAYTTSAELVETMRQTLGAGSPSDAQDSFDWLSGQSFIRWERGGLRPDFLMRMALLARLRFERPRRFHSLTQALRDYSITELASTQTPELAFLNLLFLNRNSGGPRTWVPTDLEAVIPFEAARTEDHSQVLSLIREAEGPEAEAIARAYLGVRGHQFEVSRADVVEGVLHHVELAQHLGASMLYVPDPALGLVARFVAEHPLEPNESALLFRWFLDRRDHQQLTPRVLLSTARQMQLLLAPPRAYSFCVYRTPSDWVPLWKDFNVPWEEVGRFQLGSHEYFVVAFRWRRKSMRDVLFNAGSLMARDGPSGDVPLSADELRVKVGERVAKLAQKSRLTPREAEILEHLCLGDSFDEIARSLSIRPRTVKFHQENLLRKTGASSRTELFRKLL